MKCGSWQATCHGDGSETWHSHTSIKTLGAAHRTAAAFSDGCETLRKAHGSSHGVLFSMEDAVRKKGRRAGNEAGMDAPGGGNINLVRALPQKRRQKPFTTRQTPSTPSPPARATNGSEAKPHGRGSGQPPAPRPVRPRRRLSRRLPTRTAAAGAEAAGGHLPGGAPAPDGVSGRGEPGCASGLSRP